MYNGTVKKVRVFALVGLVVAVVIGGFLVKPGRSTVERVVIIDRSMGTAYDWNGFPTDPRPSWLKWTTGPSSRQICVTLLQPNLSDRTYRLRYMNGINTHGAVIEKRVTLRGTEVDVLADYPIEDSDAPIKLTIEGTDGKWETVYSGAKGQNTAFAFWKLDHPTTPSFRITNAIEPGSDPGRYEFRYNSNLPPGKFWMTQSSDGTITSYDPGALGSISRIEAQRSEYKEIDTRWVAFGKKGRPEDFREVGSDPKIVAIFSGKPEASLRKDKWNSFYERDKQGWTLDGDPYVGRVQTSTVTNTTGDPLPAWVLVRLPRAMAKMPVHLLASDGSDACHFSEPIDPASDGSATRLFAVKSKYLSGAADLRLRVTLPEKSPVGTCSIEKNVGPERLNAGEFCISKWNVSDNYVAAKIPEAVRNAHVSLTAKDTTGVIVAQGSGLVSNQFCGTTIYPIYASRKIAKVELYAQPYKYFEFKDVPLIRPKPLAKPRLPASPY